MPSLSPIQQEGDGAGLSTWSLEEGIDIGAAPGGLAGDFTSPLVKSLQSRLERAEEQVRRARERERGLRERLEGDDISHLLAAQRAQAESLRKENDKLRQEIQAMQDDRDGSEMLRKLSVQLRESEAQCKHLTSQLEAEREHSHALEERARRADANAKTASELERTAQSLRAQLQAASSDLDEAAQHELGRQQEVAKLRQEIEMQQMDIVSLQKQLSDAVAEDSALRMEKDEEIEKMQVRMVSKQDLELAKQDNLALYNKNTELRTTISEREDQLRDKIRQIADLELQLSEASSMWHAAARDGQDLRKIIKELEAREPEKLAIEEGLKRQIDDKQGEVGKKVDELLEANKRIAALTIELHSLSGRLSQSRSEHLECLNRISQLTQNTVSADVHARAKESLERALDQKSNEMLQLKQENESLRDKMGSRASSSIDHLYGLREQMVGLENTMQVIEQAGFTMKTDTLHELGRLQTTNRDLQRSVMQVSRDLQHQRSNTGRVDADVQNQMRLLKTKAEQEAQLREREQKKSRVLDEIMSEMSLRLLEAEDAAVISEQYLRDVSRALRVAPANLPTSPTKFRTLPALSAKEKGRSPLRKLFLDLETAADDMDGKYQVLSPGEQRVEVYQKKVKELETELFELRANSIPLRDYKEITQELASECDNVRKFAEEHLTARFHQQTAIMDQLKKERDSALDRVNVLENQLNRQKVGLEKGTKASAALQSRVKILESEIEALRRSIEMQQQQKEEVTQLYTDLQVRFKYLQQERDQLEADLRTSERNITQLKSVIKVATDQVRRAAEQRQSDAALRTQGDGESPQGAPLRLQVLEMSKERDDLMEQVRASSQREADAVHLFEAARAREADAQQQLWAVRQELADLRSVASSLSDKLNREAAEEYERKLRESAARASARAVERDRSVENAGGAGAGAAAGGGPLTGPDTAHGAGAGDTDTDTDSELPLPPSHEKARHSDTGGASEQASRPPRGRMSAPDGGIGRGVVPRRTAADSDDEDEYVRQASKRASTSRFNTPTQSVNESTAAVAGSFVSMGTQLEPRLASHGR